MGELEQVVVRVIGSHPTGKRRRAGFLFGFKPTLIQVTKQELDIINDDKWLAIVDRGLALETGMNNPQERPTGVVNEEQKEKEKEKETETEKETEKETEETLTVESLMKLKRDELVELAVDCGAVNGETFNEETIKRDLATFIINNTN